MDPLVMNILGFLALAGFVFCIGMIVLSILFFRRKNKVAGIIFICIGAFSIVFPLILSVAFFFCYTFSNSGLFEPYKEVKFSPEEYKGPMATLVFETKCKSELRGTSSEDKTNYVFSSEDGVFKVPIKKMFYNYSIFKTDNSGKEWKATTFLHDVVGFSKDSTTSIKSGPPLKSKITISKKSGNEVSLSLNICDAQGNEFRINPLSYDNSDEGSPGFELISPSGEKLWQGQFNYG